MTDQEKINPTDTDDHVEETSEPVYTRIIREKQIKKDLQKETEEQFYD